MAAVWAYYLLYAHVVAKCQTLASHLLMLDGDDD